MLLVLALTMIFAVSTNVLAAATGSDIVSYAKKFVGTPYVAGGSTSNGFDYSGFVQYVYKKYNINLPRTSTNQSNEGTSVKKSRS